MGKNFIAKPIIDILLVFMPGADKKMVISGLETLGYTHWGYNGVPGREYFTKGTENITYFHLHAFNAGAREATNHRRIVTLLNQIPYYKEKYRQYKLDNCQNNRLSYTENKASLMTAMLTSHEIRLLNRSEFKQGREIVRSYLPDQEEAYNRWYEKYAPYYFGCFIKDQSNVDNNPPESTLIGLAFGLPPWLPCLSRYESF